VSDRPAKPSLQPPPSHHSATSGTGGSQIALESVLSEISDEVTQEAILRIEREKRRPPPRR
jgi:hypothetical protein